MQAGGREADPGAGGYSDHGANIRVQCRPGYTLQDTQRWAGVVWCGGGHPSFATSILIILTEIIFTKR